MTCVPAQSPRIQASEADILPFVAQIIFSIKGQFSVGLHVIYLDKIRAIIATCFDASKSRDAEADKYAPRSNLFANVYVKNILLTKL